MPGGRPLWTWEKPPVYVVVIFCAAWIEFALSWILSEALDRWAQSVRDASHPIELMQGGRPYYLSPGMSWFLTHDILIFFGLLGTLFVIVLLNWKKIERVR